MGGAGVKGWDGVDFKDNCLAARLHPQQHPIMCSPSSPTRPPSVLCPAAPYRTAPHCVPPYCTAGQQLYREVKQASDSMLGVPSQCVVAKKAGIGFPARGRSQCESGAPSSALPVLTYPLSSTSHTLPLSTTATTADHYPLPPPTTTATVRLQTAPTWRSRSTPSWTGAT